MNGVGEVLEAAREAYRRRDWARARERFAAARAAGELTATDLDALADAAWWLGEVEEASAVLEAAYRRHLDDGRPGRAAMAAIGIAVNHLLRGDGVVGSGWLGRAQRLVRDEPEGVAHGYLLYLPLVPGLAERLAAGARVADVGCGTGHAIVLLAAAYPASTFVGYDLADDAIARARSEAAAAGLPNARFEVRDAARLTVEEPFDAVFVFDAVHDQVAPAAVLERLHAALAPGGTFVMVEPRASSDLAGNLGNPVAPLLYSVSTLHCLTVSLAGGGAGLGAAWGEELARWMLADAGFVDVAVHEAPGDPLNAVFVATRPAA